MNDNEPHPELREYWAGQMVACLEAGHDSEAAADIMLAVAACCLGNTYGKRRAAQMLFMLAQKFHQEGEAERAHIGGLH